MTIDEAIAHAREAAAIQRNNDKLNKTLGKSSPYYNMDCIKYAEEHEQIAEWLEELKAIKSDGFTDDLLNMGFTKGYNKALNDFVQKVKEHHYVLSDAIHSTDYGMFTVGIEQIAEELKENFDTVN